MYFLPASTWAGNDFKIDIDFNFKNDAAIETICNISIRQKGKLPKGISSIILNANSIDYFLHDMETLSIDSKINMARITSRLSYDNFLNIMKAENVYLQIIIDGLRYKCIPSREFLMLQSEFQNSYFEIANIVNKN
jgi:hypothetical protein